MPLWAIPILSDDPYRSSKSVPLSDRAAGKMEREEEAQKGNRAVVGHPVRVLPALEGW